MLKHIMFSSLFALGLTLSSVGCSSNGSGGASSSATEDTSASGVAASAVGGALGGSANGGTVALLDATPASSKFSFALRALLPNAFASVACPTLLTAAGSGCTQTSSTVDTLTYAACGFGSSQATWTGNLDVSVGSSTITCGTFPTVSSIGSLYRQFVSGGGAASSGSRTSVFGTVVTIDDATSNLGNYQGDVISAIHNSGYGSEVVFNGSGARTGVTIGHHISAASFDHSVTGTVSVSETAGTTRTISGSVTTYHNKVKMKGTTTFSSVVYNNTCCQPISGTISTVFTTTSQSPTNIITTAMNGKTESLKISGCGAATYVDYAGASSTVTLSGCY